MSSIKILSAFIITIIVLTTALATLYLYTPVLIGYQTTSDGVIVYFKNVFDPSFIIKTYVNNALASTIISVYINQPNNVKFYKDYYGQTLKIPFSAITEYIKPWEKYNVINTSLLIIATYIQGGKAYTAAEEVEYNPSWLLNNNPIQIVATINIVPHLVKANNTTGEQITEQLTNTSNATKYPYTINVTEKEYDEPQIYLSSAVFTPVTSITYFYNFSVPLTWVTLSNNVKNKDNYTWITVGTCFFGGNASWFGVSNPKGSYIGVSYSTHIHDTIYDSPVKASLSNLSYPIIYNYYNATIAAVTYVVCKSIRGLNIPVGNTSVLEISSISGLGSNVESGDGVTRIVFTNSTGKYVYYLHIGNGSVKLFYTYFGEFIKTLKGLQYGYVYKENGKIVKAENVSIGGNNDCFYVWCILRPNNQPELRPIGTQAMLVSSGNAQVYFSYFYYSTSWGMPISGFILNYSSYYEGLKYE
ncbi:hypothetical protein HS7_04260 [Sulfolobales archaeon HS-7]|nr:hypothetical protein HS7_04260 [Sulfolobales archaeon HS-7]